MASLQMRLVYRTLGTFLLLFILSFFLTRCANIVPPNGGPRDTIPPVLINAIPHDSTLHFHSRSITLNFDEYIQLQDANKALIFTPSVLKQPVIISKFRTLTIQLKDTLKANTTYILNFGNAIRDLDEGNPIKDFKYIFSTGNYLDSLSVSGQVSYAETGQVDSEIVVMLYSDLSDSAVTRQKPVYYTRSDNKGNFSIQNLPKGTFKIFALKDENAALAYVDSSEFIAYLDSPVTVSGNVTGLHLYLFAAASKAPGQAQTALQPPPAATGNSGKKRVIRHLNISPQLSLGGADITGPLKLLLDQHAKFMDTSKAHLFEDTTFTPVKVSVALDSARTSVSIARTWDPEMYYRLILDSGFVSDSAGAHNLADTIDFRTKSESDYGSINLIFNGTDSTLSYVVEIVSNNEIKYSGPLTGHIWRKALVQPGEYTVRLLLDTNRNGKWDNGKYYGGKRQSEHVISFPQKINIRANWDNRTQFNL
jgi:hypothetical protein